MHYPAPHSAASLLASTALFCMFGLTSVSSQALEVYKSIGAYGEVKYSQHKPQNASNVEIIEFRSDGRQATAGKMAGKIDPDQRSNIPTPEEQRIAQLEARLQQQEEQKNARRCQSLRNNLTNLNVGGRIYEMDEDGNRKYLDSREIELKRERMQKAIDQYCEGPTI